MPRGRRNTPLTLVCMDCLTMYHAWGFMNKVQRCERCRAARRIELQKGRARSWRKLNRERLNEQGRTPDPITGASMNRAWHLRKNYGIGIADYERMLQAQGGTCAMCDATPETQRWGVLDVDHNHTTGKVRALLCNRHNKGIGHFDDDPKELRAAADYLERYAS